MSNTFADDFRWQLQFQPAVREIVMSAFGIGGVDVTFTSPDSDDDRRFNTDILIVFDGRVHRVSQRLRRYVVGDEFTLRYGRPSSPTEWQKLWAGFGDYLIYGRGLRNLRVDTWFVGAMDVFRSWAKSFLDRGDVPPHISQTNADGSSSFVAFSRSDLPPEFTVAEDEEADLRDAWWAIVKDSRGMEATGHAAAVRWARAGLGLDK